MRLNRISLLFLFLCSGCVVSNIGTTSPSVNEIKSASSTEVNNFNVLTEVTAIATKEPWVYESPSPTPVAVNEYITGIGYADLNYKNGYESTPFEIKTNNQRLISNNGYYKLDRKTRTIGLADGLAIEFDYSKAYTKPKCCWSTRDIDLYDSFNGRVELELDKDTTNLSLKAKNVASASMFRKMTHYGGAFCYYSAMASVSLIPSGNLSYINKKIYGSLSYHVSGYYGSIDTLCGGLEPKNTDPGYKSGNASVSFSVEIPKDPPVDVEVKVSDINGVFNEIISPANQDGKYDKAKLLITTMSYDEWVLIAEGKDIYGNVRRYMEEGKGNKDIEFKGKTNDAIDSKNDMYFADGELKLTLTSKNSGEKSEGRVFIDNTPPEVKVNNVSINVSSGVIEGNVIDKFPDYQYIIRNDSAVSGLDELTMPGNMSRKVYNSKGEEIEQIYRLRNSFKDSFSGEVSGISDLDDIDSIKYEVISGIKAKVSDKVGNVASGFVGIAEPEQEGIEQTEGFSTQGVIKGINIGKKKVNGKSGEGFNLFCAPSSLDHVLNRVKGFLNGYEIGSGNRFLGLFLLGRCPNSYFPVEKVDLWGEVKITVPYGNTMRTIRLQPITRRTAYLNDITGFTYGKESIWYGSVRNLSQVYDKTKSFDTIYNSSESGKDSINNVFAGAPFATNGTGKLIAEVNFENKVSGYRDHAHVEYYFSIKNEHPDYNNKFVSNRRNPYPISDERRNHIKVRHDLNYLNSAQFIKAYIGKFADNATDRANVLNDFTEKIKGSENFKGSCWNENDMKTNESDMFDAMREVAEMTDINDYWKSQTPNYLIIEGKRIAGGGEHIINSLIKIQSKDYLFGSVGDGSSFPDDKSTRDLNIIDGGKNEVEDRVKTLSESQLEDRFNDFVNLGYKKPYDIQTAFKGIFKEAKTLFYNTITLKGGKKFLSDSPTGNAIYHKTINVNGNSINSPVNKW